MQTARTISRRPSRRGASSLEYMLVLLMVVFPIVLCTPLLMNMISIYSSRVTWVLRLPFG